MNFSFDEDIDPSNPVKLNLLVFVLSPVAHSRHVGSASIVLFITLGQDNVFVESGSQSSAFIRLDPGIVVETTFDVPSILIAMKPDI